MRRTAFLLMLFLMVLAFPGRSLAEIFYVRADAPGDNTGSDWINAFRSLPGELQRGSTYYVASGEYPNYTFDDPVPEEPEFIYIKKAIPGDHGTDTGWEDYLGEGSAVFEAPLVFKAGYYEIDGQVGGGPGSWNSGHGITVRHSGSSDQVKLIRMADRVTNLVFKHIEMYFNQCTTCSGQDILYGLSGGSDWTFRNCYMHHAGRVILLTFGSTSDVLIENSLLERNGVSSTQHSEIWIARDANNITLRNSVIADFVSTGGVIISRGENWDIYGNLFIWTENWGRRSMNGAIGSLASSTDYYARNINIFNNSFVNLLEGGAGKIFPIYNEIEGVKAYNNLWYNSPATSFGSGVEHNYNWFMGSNEGAIFESAMQVGEGGPFLDYSGGDFRLVSATDPGLALTEQYNTDMNGVIRGADGFWDRGAFEFESTAGEENYPPSAFDDNAATAEDTPVTIDVLANDTDPEEDALTVNVLSAPGSGTLTLNPDQTVTYTPAPGFSGMDSFTYTAHDGRAESNAASVTVTVSRQETLVANDDAYSADEDSILDIEAPGVLGNDSLEGNSPSAELVAGTINGTVTLNPDGSFRYEPLADYNGQDSFSYRVVTGLSESNTAAVALTVSPVNDPPFAADDSAATFRDAPVDINVLANDTDIEGDALTVAALAGPQNGTVGLNPDQTVTYTPALGFAGVDSITYRAYDGESESNTATVTIVVQARPESVNDSYSTMEDTPLDVAAPGVLGNDSGEGDLTAQLVTATANGSLTLNPDGSFVYSPGAGYSGMDSFTYKANSEGVESNAATVTISVVRESNTAPVGYQDSAATDFNTSVVIPVLENDIDADGDPLIVAAITIPPPNGTAAINPDNTVTFTPNPGFSGSDRFYYKATDGIDLSNTTRVTVSVKSNKPPVAVVDYATTSVNRPVMIDVAENDYDIDGTVVRESVTVLTRPGRGGTVVNNKAGTVTFTPAIGFSGFDYFYYNIKDDYGATSKSAKVTVKVAK